MQGLFVTGTDTDVGKTWVAGLLLKALRADRISAAAYKPVCSGAVCDRGAPRWSDVEALYAACDGEFPREQICPQRFLAPLAPPRAAAAEGRQVDAELAYRGVMAFPTADFLVVEGAGGLLCPLTEDSTIADLARELGFPLVIVAANRLGVVNHTLLTCSAAWVSGLEVAAIVLNDVAQSPDPSACGNRDDIECRLRSKPLASAWRGSEPPQVPPVLTVHWGQTAVQSRDRRLGGVDWLELAASARPKTGVDCVPTTLRLNPIDGRE